MDSPHHILPFSMKSEVGSLFPCLGKQALPGHATSSEHYWLSVQVWELLTQWSLHIQTTTPDKPEHATLFIIF